jgi:uncharacterized repeat protein (TIGR02543 family)
VKITILCILIILATQFSNANAAASPQLAPGTWWTLKGTYQEQNSGTGYDTGSYTQTGNFTTKFVITSSDSNTTTISINSDGTALCGGNGTTVTTFKSISCTPTSTWTYSSTREYVIYTNTLLVQSFTDNGAANPWPQGHPVWVLTNPSKLIEGGTTPLFWCVPKPDAKDCTVTDVQASVSTQQLSLKGNMAKIWVVTHTGNATGTFQDNNGVYSWGRETERYQYDPGYGIVVGLSFNWKMEGTETGGVVGTWTENYSENSQFVDSSLSFTAAATINVEPSANLYVTVDGVKYNGNQLPKTFTWFVGSTHTLAVNSTIQGTGMRYFFVQWSDGSKDASRTFTVTQDTVLTATYKTQYQLTVTSDIGSPQGSGWYDAGTQATFSVSSPQPESGLMGTLGGKSIFQGWSGDSNAASPSATVNMNGPKTVTATWTTDNTQPYIILGGIAAVIVIAAALVIFMRRKKT